MKLTIATLLLVALVAQAENPDVRIVIDEPDAGAAEQVTFAHLQQLAGEYDCPDAGAPQELDGGYRLEDPARAARVDCLLARSSAEVFSWRGLDAGTITPLDTTALHVVTAIVSSATAVFSAYAANRTARHLQLWPP